MASGNTSPSGSSGDSSTGGKIKQAHTLSNEIRGVAEVIHGLGDSMRGRFMDFLDSSKGIQHPETQKGREEVERGIAKLKGRRAEQPAQGNSGPGAGGKGPQAGEGQQSGAGGSQGPAENVGSNITQTQQPQPAYPGPGAGMPMSAGPSADAGGVAPQQYSGGQRAQDNIGGGTGIAGGNNKEFQQNAPGGLGDAGGPVVDTTNYGPGTGVPSGGPQKLP